MNSYESGSFSRWCLNPHRCFQYRFEALFPRNGALGCTVCFAPECSSWFICTPIWDHPLHQLPPCHILLPPPCLKTSPPRCPSPPLLPVWMNVSSLTPWWSDFHTVQFWLFFVFKLLLSFFWLSEEAQCVYLCPHLGWKPPIWYLILSEK